MSIFEWPFYTGFTVLNSIEKIYIEKIAKLMCSALACQLCLLLIEGLNLYCLLISHPLISRYQYIDLTICMLSNFASFFLLPACLEVNLMLLNQLKANNDNNEHLSDNLLGTSLSICLYHKQLEASLSICLTVS